MYFKLYDYQVIMGQMKLGKEIIKFCEAVGRTNDNLSYPIQ